MVGPLAEPPDPGPTVVIVDDHPAIVDGVRAWCAGADPPIAVVDSGNRPHVAFTGAGRTADVVVFDLLYDGQPDFAALRRLVAEGRRIIVYSQEESADTVLRCVELGVATYLTKVEGDGHLVPAIRAIAAGGTYTGPMLSGVLAGDRRADRPVLSEREREVLIAWFECESKNLVAKRLHLSVKTVDTYIERVRMKYADTGRPATSKSALMIRALQDGIVDLGDLGEQD
ncbi:MAG TPA: response regulator transcription factor [Pseudonocardia sp.]|nr:response regulator transcription factor [Pseudonocardia sp.]